MLDRIIYGRVRRTLEPRRPWTPLLRGLAWLALAAGLTAAAPVPLLIVAGSDSDALHFAAQGLAYAVVTSVALFAASTLARPAPLQLAPVHEGE